MELTSQGQMLQQTTVWQVPWCVRWSSSNAARHSLYLTSHYDTIGSSRASSSWACQPVCHFYVSTVCTQSVIAGSCCRRLRGAGPVAALALAVWRSTPRHLHVHSVHHNSCEHTHCSWSMSSASLLCKQHIQYPSCQGLLTQAVCDHQQLRQLFESTLQVESNCVVLLGHRC
jgi:hypothetical protein